ncbi:hypothetical protein Btru_052213 [Bulinus truncatus]|nr:hypothetical protein Btru_052213 [Bulinus truncatus]
MSCEKSDPLLLETVWLSQTEFEKAEALFQTLSLQDVKIDLDCTVDKNLDKDFSCYKGETVWLQQMHYEEAEAQYHMYLSGTLDSSPAGNPEKHFHGLGENKLIKKKRQEINTREAPIEKKLRNNIATLSKTVKHIHDRLQEFEKMQKRKSQAIQETISHLTSALEACQLRLQEELIKSSSHLSSFHSLLGDFGTVILTTTNALDEGSWGNFKSHKSFCQSMSQVISTLNADIGQCSETLNCFQADVSKTDINKIVGEISKISLMKNFSGFDKFTSKKDAITKSIADMLDPGYKEDLSSSGGSLEGSGSVSENSENELESRSTKVPNTKEPQNQKENKSYSGKVNRNNSSSASRWPANMNQTGKGRNDQNCLQNASSTPKKRNAQGAPQKKPELFKFKGVTVSSKTPFMHQPGLLGPRPNLIQTTNQQNPFRFSNFNTLVQQQQQTPLQSFGTFGNVNPVTSGSRSTFGNLNFNFANQSRGNSLLPNPSLNLNTSQGQVNSQMIPNLTGQLRQSKFQANQTHSKMMKGQEHFGLQSRNAGFSFPYQRTSMGSGLVQNAQGNLMNTFTGLPQGTLEQQLNEMSQKIQQMQLVASQNFQLQHLMQETERLKQMVAQKQHQQQDRFQHQFQLLINAFMQQQQLTQGPQSKIAKSVMYQNSQRQRLIQNRQHQLQQQKKHKQQQNKVQQVRQEQSNPLKKLKPESPLNPEKQTISSVGGETVLTTLKPKKLPNNTCHVTKLSSLNPQAAGDKHRAGISSMVVLDYLGCLVLTDIINSCLKLYEISQHPPTNEYVHSFVTRLELPRPYYMSKLNGDMLIISREGKKLSLVRVLKKRLEFLRDITTEVQYYGVAYVKENIIACAAYIDNRIDLVNIQSNKVQASRLAERSRGPELVCSIYPNGSILYLERVPDTAVRMVCISQNSEVEFVVNLNSRASDVWNFTSIDDVIICSNKQSSEIQLFSNTGNLLGELKFPSCMINQPFAMAFCHNGNLYIANDGDWDSEYGHYITTEINLYEFS